MTVLSRTMTFKSKYDYGKYKGMSVEEVAGMDMDYIVWSYFMLSKIGYSDDVLNLVGIDEEYRIQKPSVNEHMLNTFKKVKWNRGDTHKQIKIVEQRKQELNKHLRLKSEEFFQKDKEYFSKVAMQRRNHNKR